MVVFAIAVLMMCPVDNNKQKGEHKLISSWAAYALLPKLSGCICIKVGRLTEVLLMMKGREHIWTVSDTNGGGGSSGSGGPRRRRRLSLFQSPS